MEYIYMVNKNDLDNKNVEVHERLYKLLESQELIENKPFESGTRTLLIKKDLADKVVAESNDKELQEEYERCLNGHKHKCNCCGTYSNMFKQDYRGDVCISKYISCPLCYCLEDKDYFEIMRSNNNELILKKLEII